jgi:hypothetical protein
MWMNCLNRSFLLNFSPSQISHDRESEKRRNDMSNFTINTLAGNISTEATKRGLKFFSFNHERRKYLHIGTLIGATYEKSSAVLRSPEPSLCVSESEFGAVQEAGGQFIRFIVGRSHTYSISVLDFARQAEKYFSAGYGDQLRVKLTAFSSIATVRPRNLIVDSPRLSQAKPIGPRQLSLFGKG